MKTGELCIAVHPGGSQQSHPRVQEEHSALKARGMSIQVMRRVLKIVKIDAAQELRCLEDLVHGRNRYPLKAASWLLVCGRYRWWVFPGRPGEPI